MREGYPSASRSDDGIYLLSTGDAGPRPYGNIHIVQYGPDDQVLLHLIHERQANGDGYTDFFGSSACRPSTGVHSLRVRVPATGIDQVIFTCSFAQEINGGALRARLKDFLDNREYQTYTGWPSVPAVPPTQG